MCVALREAWLYCGSQSRLLTPGLGALARSLLHRRGALQTRLVVRQQMRLAALDRSSRRRADAAIAFKRMRVNSGLRPSMNSRGAVSEGLQSGGDRAPTAQDRSAGCDPELPVTPARAVIYARNQFGHGLGQILMQRSS